MSNKQSMPVKIPIDQAEREFRDIARRVGSGEEHFVVEQEGEAEVVIVSMKEFEELKQARHYRDVSEMSAEERLAEFDKIHALFNAAAKRLGLSEDEEVEKMIQNRGEIVDQYYANRGK